MLSSVEKSLQLKKNEIIAKFNPLEISDGHYGWLIKILKNTHIWLDESGYALIVEYDILEPNGSILDHLHDSVRFSKLDQFKQVRKCITEKLEVLLENYPYNSSVKSLLSEIYKL